MRISSSINCFFDGQFAVPVGTQIQRMYDAGFRTLDMNFWDWCHDKNSPFVGDGWEDWVRSVGVIADGLNVRFTQAHAHVYSFVKQPDAADQYEMYRRSLEGAAILGIPWVVFHPSAMRDYDAPDAVDRMIEANLAFFAPLVELAESLGTGLAMENMSTVQHGLTDAQSLSRLIDRFESKAVGACWDTGHAHIAGVDQAESMKTLGHRLKALHVQDNNGVADEHMPCHFGTIDWKPLIGALYDIGYEGDFTFEAHSIVRKVPEYAKAAAARLMHDIGAGLIAR